MKVFGKPLADTILNSLKLEIEEDKLKPNLVIILATDDQPVLSYIRKKIEAGLKIGVLVTVLKFNELQESEALEKIKELNSDPATSGIIVQLPVFDSWDKEKLINAVDIKKDVDGFLENSPYVPATAGGVWELLNQIGRESGFDNAEKFLNEKNIVVLGKGKTAGFPIRKLIENYGFKVSVIDSKTKNPKEIIKKADVIICAVGKKDLITADLIKPGSTVINVGAQVVGLENDKKVVGDVSENVADVAGFYTGAIGGVGPLTVACLLRNVVKASK